MELIGHAQEAEVGRVRTIDSVFAVGTELVVACEVMQILILRLQFSEGFFQRGPTRGIELGFVILQKGIAVGAIFGEDDWSCRMSFAVQRPSCSAGSR